jgi:predicted ATPase
LNNQPHNICDVGFGCSQVLPVLVGSLNIFVARAPAAIPMFIVQEPEIHLHPDAQAALGSFFVSLVQKTGQIFVETHSDTLVLRIARHVAGGQLKPDDVHIFFFSNSKRGKRVQKIRLDARATFQPHWPGGFFPQREREALGLARARMGQDGTRETRAPKFSYPKAAE